MAEHRLPSPVIRVMRGKEDLLHRFQIFLIDPFYSIIDVGQLQKRSRRGGFADPGHFKTEGWSKQSERDIRAAFWRPRRVARQFGAKRRIVIGGIHFRRYNLNGAEARSAGPKPKKERHDLPLLLIGVP